MNVRHGTVDEDLKGYDFLAFYEGQLVTLDAKTGLYRPLTERKHGHRHLESRCRGKPWMDSGSRGMVSRSCGRRCGKLCMINPGVVRGIITDIEL